MSVGRGPTASGTGLQRLVLHDRTPLCALVDSPPGRSPVTTRSDIGAAVAAAARSMSQPQSLQETLEAIVEAARSSVPGFDNVGISTVLRHGVAETRAATGGLVKRLDTIQY